MQVSLCLIFIWIRGGWFVQFNLKSNCATDHSTKAGLAGPSASDLAFDEYVTVRVAHSNTRASGVALVAGIERARKPSRRRERIGIRNTDCLHWRERWRGRK